MSIERSLGTMTGMVADNQDSRCDSQAGGVAASDDGQTYWAFISYSHRDERWAKWLQRKLEGYRVPSRLVGRETRAGTTPRRFGRVFRDRDELASSSDLASDIADALRRSRYL